MVHNGRITICDPQATNRYGIKRSELWATSGTRLHGIQRNVLQTCDLPADQAIVGHKRYQTVWYSTERITNLRPTSEPSELWATSGTRLYGTQRKVLQTCDPQANQANCRPQAVPDCMVLNGTYYKLATHKRTKQIVGHERYQTVWYSTERIINLRPTSEPRKL